MRGEALNKDLVLTKLEPYLKLGVSLNRACNLYNTDFNNIDHVARSTVQTWYENDDAVRQKIDAFIDYPAILARRGWLKKLEEGDYTACRDWLLRKEKIETSEEYVGVSSIRYEVVDSTSSTASEGLQPTT